MKNKYPVIEFVSASKILRDQTSILLEEQGIKHYNWTYTPKKRGGPTHYLRILGKKRCCAFVEHIGLSNPKHQKRFKSS